MFAVLTLLPALKGTALAGEHDCAVFFFAFVMPPSRVSVGAE